jgi:hypothetical protein
MEDGTEKDHGSSSRMSVARKGRLISEQVCIQGFISRITQLSKTLEDIQNRLK